MLGPFKRPFLYIFIFVHLAATPTALAATVLCLWSLLCLLPRINGAREASLGHRISSTCEPLQRRSKLLRLHTVFSMHVSRDRLGLQLPD